MSTTKVSKTKLSKEEGKIKTKMSTKIINDKIEQIKDFERSIVRDIKNNTINDADTIKSVFSISDGAKSQLERGGTQFTKPDLVAIIVALDAGKIPLMNDLNKLRISDLNSIIRSIIYDTNRYMLATNNNFMNMHIENATDKKSNTREITNIDTSLSKKKEKKTINGINNNNNNTEIVLYK